MTHYATFWRVVVWTPGGIQIICSCDIIIIAEYLSVATIVIIIETLGLIWFLYCNLLLDKIC